MTYNPGKIIKVLFRGIEPKKGYVTYYVRKGAVAWPEKVFLKEIYIQFSEEALQEFKNGYETEVIEDWKEAIDIYPEIGTVLKEKLEKIMAAKSIRVSDETYRRIVQVKGELTSKRKEELSFDETLSAILDKYQSGQTTSGPIMNTSFISEDEIQSKKSVKQNINKKNN